MVASQILRRVTNLILRNNALVSTWGLHRIASLECLDLSYNLISNFREVELLGELPALRFLWLEGNPITFGRWYRREVLSYFRDPMKVSDASSPVLVNPFLFPRAVFSYVLTSHLNVSDGLFLDISKH